MYCPIHLVIGKLDKLDISEEITKMDDTVRIPMLPIMANIEVPIRLPNDATRIREKMRIDEPLDHITHAEHIKFEQLCCDFRKVTDKMNEDKDYVFPEDFFLR